MEDTSKNNEKKCDRKIYKNNIYESILFITFGKYIEEDKKAKSIYKIPALRRLFSISDTTMKYIVGTKKRESSYKTNTSYNYYKDDTNGYQTKFGITEKLMNGCITIQQAIVIIGEQMFKNGTCQGNLEKAKEYYKETITSISKLLVNDDNLNKNEVTVLQKMLKGIERTNRHSEIVKSIWYQAQYGLKSEHLERDMCIVSSEDGNIQKVTLDSINPSYNQYKLINNISFSEGFIGRHNELDQINKKINSYNKLFLVGMGGIGKTRLVKEYAYKYEDEFENIVFISFSDSLTTSIASDEQLKICGMERGDGDLVHYFNLKMDVLRSIVTPKTLIIIDNFDININRLKENIQEFGRLRSLLQLNCKILFTTRTDFSGFEEFNTYEIETIDMEHLKELFKLYYKFDNADETQVEKLIKTAQYHTLTVIILAKQMAASRKTPAAMLQILNDRGLRNLNENLTQTIMHSTPTKVCDVGFNFLKELYKMGNLNEEEKSLMNDLALLSVSGISISTFWEWREKTEHQTINRLHQQSWIQIENNIYSLHSLISEIILSEYDENTIYHNTFLKNALSDKYIDTPEITDKRREIARKVLTILPEISQDNDGIYYSAARVLGTYITDQEQRNNIYRNVFNFRINYYPEGHNKIVEIVLSIIEALSIDELRKNNYMDFIEKLINQLSNQRKYMLSVQLRIAIGRKYNMQNEVQNFKESIKKAKFEYSKIEEDQSEHLREIHVLFMYDAALLKATLCHNALSMVYDLDGKYKEALECEQEGWEVIQQWHANPDESEEQVNRWKELNHQSFLSSQGKYYIKMGKWTEAEKVLTDSEEILIKYRNDKHSSFARIYEELLRVYGHNNDHENLEKYKNKMQTMLQLNYAKDHPLRVRLTKEFLDNVSEDGYMKIQSADIKQRNEEPDLRIDCSSRNGQG